jgi:hypothetical protein
MAMNHRRSAGDRLPLLAGWLFADLLLAFSVIVLGATRASAPQAEPEPLPTATTTTTTTVPPPPVGVATQPIELRLPVDGRAIERGDENAIAAATEVLRTELALRGLSASRAGFVITFGFAPEFSEGLRIAQAFNDRVIAPFGPSYATAPTKSLANVSSDPATTGQIEIEIYPLL